MPRVDTSWALLRLEAQETENARLSKQLAAADGLNRDLKTRNTFLESLVERKSRELESLGGGASIRTGGRGGGSGGGEVARDLFKRIVLEKIVREKDEEVQRLRSHVKLTSHREAEIQGAEYLLEIQRLQMLLAAATSSAAAAASAAESSSLQAAAAAAHEIAAEEIKAAHYQQQQQQHQQHQERGQQEQQQQRLFVVAPPPSFSPSLMSSPGLDEEKDEVEDDKEEEEPRKQTRVRATRPPSPSSSARLKTRLRPPTPTKAKTTNTTATTTQRQNSPVFSTSSPKNPEEDVEEEEERRRPPRPSPPRKIAVGPYQSSVYSSRAFVPDENSHQTQNQDQRPHDGWGNHNPPLHPQQQQQQQQQEKQQQQQQLGQGPVHNHHTGSKDGAGLLNSPTRSRVGAGSWFSENDQTKNQHHNQTHHQKKKKNVWGHGSTFFRPSDATFGLPPPNTPDDYSVARTRESKARGGGGGVVVIQSQAVEVKGRRRGPQASSSGGIVQEGSGNGYDPVVKKLRSSLRKQLKAIEVERQRDARWRQLQAEDDAEKQLKLNLHLQSTQEEEGGCDTDQPFRRQQQRQQRQQQQQQQQREEEREEHKHRPRHGPGEALPFDDNEEDDSEEEDDEEEWWDSAPPASPSIASSALAAERAGVDNNFNRGGGGGGDRVAATSVPTSPSISLPTSTSTRSSPADTVRHLREQKKHQRRHKHRRGEEEEEEHRQHPKKQQPQHQRSRHQELRQRQEHRQEQRQVQEQAHRQRGRRDERTGGQEELEATREDDGWMATKNSGVGGDGREGVRGDAGGGGGGGDAAGASGGGGGAGVGDANDDEGGDEDETSAQAAADQALLAAQAVTLNDTFALRELQLQLQLEEGRENETKSRRKEATKGGTAEAAAEEAAAAALNGQSGKGAAKVEAAKREVVEASKRNQQKQKEPRAGAEQGCSGQEGSGHGGCAVVFTVESAAGLLASDSNGSSDPYVVVELADASTGEVIGTKKGQSKKLGRRHKTSTVKKSLDPSWPSEREVRWEFDAADLLLAGGAGAESGLALKVSVKDADGLVGGLLSGGDDSLGVALVPFHALPLVLPKTHSSGSADPGAAAAAAAAGAAASLGRPTRSRPVVTYALETTAKMKLNATGSVRVRCGMETNPTHEEEAAEAQATGTVQQGDTQKPTSSASSAAPFAAADAAAPPFATAEEKGGAPVIKTATKKTKKKNDLKGLRRVVSFDAVLTEEQPFYKADPVASLHFLPPTQSFNEDELEDAEDTPQNVQGSEPRHESQQQQQQQQQQVESPVQQQPPRQPQLQPQLQPSPEQLQPNQQLGGSGSSGGGAIASSSNSMSGKAGGGSNSGSSSPVGEVGRNKGGGGEGRGSLDGDESVGESVEHSVQNSVEDPKEEEESSHNKHVLGKDNGGDDDGDDDGGNGDGALELEEEFGDGEDQEDDELEALHEAAMCAVAESNDQEASQARHARGHQASIQQGMKEVELGLRPGSVTPSLRSGDTPSPRLRSPSPQASSSSSSQPLGSAAHSAVSSSVSSSVAAAAASVNDHTDKLANRSRSHDNSHSRDNSNSHIHNAAAAREGGGSGGEEELRGWLLDKASEQGLFRTVTQRLQPYLTQRGVTSLRGLGEFGAKDFDLVLGYVHERDRGPAHAKLLTLAAEASAVAATAASAVAEKTAGAAAAAADDDDEEHASAVAAATTTSTEILSPLGGGASVVTLSERYPVAADQSRASNDDDGHGGEKNTGHQEEGDGERETEREALPAELFGRNDDADGADNNEEDESWIFDDDDAGDEDGDDGSAFDAEGGDESMHGDNDNDEEEEEEEEEGDATEEEDEASLQTGDEVEARYKGRQVWYSATVVSVQETGNAGLRGKATQTFSLLYHDDGSEETLVPRLRVRRSGEEEPCVLVAGMRCEARYHGGKKCFPGVIVWANGGERSAVDSRRNHDSAIGTSGDGKATAAPPAAADAATTMAMIEYDDGDKEANVPRYSVHVACERPKKGK